MPVMMGLLEQVGSRRAGACRPQFTCLGYRNGTHQKREIGTGPRPLVAVVHLNNTTTNWKTASMVVSGGMQEEIEATGAECVGRTLSCHLGG